MHIHVNLTTCVVQLKMLEIEGRKTSIEKTVSEIVFVPETTIRSASIASTVITEEGTSRNAGARDDIFGLFFMCQTHNSQSVHLHRVLILVKCQYASRY